jgi:hypothetical protein
MSKMEDLRAMREARYREAASRATKPTRIMVPGERRVPRSAEVQLPAADHEGPAPALCGHRAISGRTCTREHGHASKSHRYS